MDLLKHSPGFKGHLQCFNGTKAILPDKKANWNFF